VLIRTIGVMGITELKNLRLCVGVNRLSMLWGRATDRLARAPSAPRQQGRPERLVRGEELMSTPTLTPAGWYDDPESPEQQRYWDGQVWTGSTASPVTAQVATPKPIWKRWWFIGGALLLVLFVIASIAGSSNSTKTVSPASSSALSVTPTPTATPTPTPTPTPTAVAAAPKVFTYTGHGSKLLKIAKSGDGPVLVTISGHGSSSNFTVESLDSSLQMNDLLVNVIGSYSGTRLMDVNDGEVTARLKIDYPGTWKVVVHAISTAPVLTTTAAGKGDAVFIYLGSAQGIAFTNKGGDSNFVVTSYGDSGDLLVNEIGNYSGEVAIGDGPELIEIQSEGRWTMKLTG
jgi:Protein of unknown function (DUF2510)